MYFKINVLYQLINCYLLKSSIVDFDVVKLLISSNKINTKKHNEVSKKYSVSKTTKFLSFSFTNNKGCSILELFYLVY